MIRLVVFYLLTAFYYNSYRYILQINNARTSPTYTDTPLWLSSGKYLIILALFGLMVFCIVTQKYKIRTDGSAGPVRYGSGYNAVLIIMSVLFCFYAIAITVLSRDPYAFESVCFFPIFVFIVIGRFDREVFFNTVFKVIKYSTWIFLIVDIIQYLLFYFFDRLPALAYEGSVSVRFGSLQDDPNGYAFLLSALFFIGMSHQGFKKLTFYTLYFINLLLTISFTGMAAVIFSIFVVVVISTPISFYKLIAAWFSLVLGVAAVIVISQLPLVQRVISTKQGSIDQHANLFSALSDIGVLDVLGYNPPGWIAESAYVNILLNFGFFVAISMYFMVVTILLGFIKHLTKNKKYYKIIKKDPIYILGLCSFSFCLSIFFGGINLPLEVVFPVNSLFPFFLATLCLISRYDYFSTTR
jgi:hypothetical protein